jgi:hypothetical protein
MSKAEVFALGGHFYGHETSKWFIRLDGDNSRIYPLGTLLGGYEVSVLRAPEAGSLIYKAGEDKILGTLTN